VSQSISSDEGRGRGDRFGGKDPDWDVDANIGEVLDTDDDAVAVFGRFGGHQNGQILGHFKETTGFRTCAEVVAQGYRRSGALGAESGGGEVVDRAGMGGQAVRRGICPPWLALKLTIQ